MGRKQKKYYSVIRGFKPGIYDAWYGDDGAEIQVKGFSNPIYKGFKSFKEAQKWMDSFEGNGEAIYEQTATTYLSQITYSEIENSGANVIIYTDGGSLGNPGPGGFAAVIIKGKKIYEISGGYRLTTNNRMELMACVSALESIKPQSSVTLYSDSRYVVDAIAKGWAKRWQANSWMRNKTEPAKNSDLWKRLLDLCEQSSVDFKWIKGHANIPGNERCDQLAKQAAMSNELTPDKIFEKEYVKNTT
ncbi:MAG: ribonuclease HI [Desulfobacteraceae bacterium Eth-SRB2]|nr:MAG: ribonuclease HI [Desulfobacteraceae bacterium Eth-SRB2]